MDVEFKDEVKNIGGCIMPVFDPVARKYNRLCGETTLFDSAGNPMGFCSKHRNAIEEFTKHHSREANRRKANGHKNRFPKSKSFVIGKVVDRRKGQDRKSSIIVK